MNAIFRTSAILVFVVILCAVAWCAMAPSPDLVRITWMPAWLGKWANANPTFRNFPAFAALAAGFFWAGLSCFRSLRGGALAGLTAIAASIAAVVLEVVQIFLPGRFFDPMDILWSIIGAFAGTSFALAVFLVSGNWVSFRE